MSTFLGIDPGSRVTGYGIVSFKSNQFKYLDSGVIRTRASDPSDKLLEIFSNLEDIILKYRPSEAAIEKVFVHQNPTGALTLGQARGTAMVVLAKNAIPVFHYSARQIKQAVTGYGGAEKSAVLHMVQLQLAYREKLLQDESDALACAMCHAHTRTNLIAIQQNSRDLRQSYQKGRIK